MVLHTTEDPLRIFEILPAHRNLLVTPPPQNTYPWAIVSPDHLEGSPFLKYIFKEWSKIEKTHIQKVKH